jgi:moderate conductance mechanosensitive channel
MDAILNKFGWEEVPMWLELILSVWNVALILLLAWLALRLARRLIRLFREQMARHNANAEEIKRVETLSRVFRYAASVLIWVVAVMLVLSELGISIAPILATAGVAGIAIGFGAQTLVKDYFSGLFLLLENQIRQGDVVAIADKAGLVEEVTLRYVRLRDYEGAVHFVPNSSITTVTNRSRDFAFAVIDVGVAYKEDTDRVFEVMREVAANLRRDPDFGPRIVDDLDIAGVDNWADSSVMIRCRMKTLPLEQWGVRREFLRRLKKAFDASGIEIPFPHLTLYAGTDKNSVPLPLRLIDGSTSAARGSV